MAVGGGLGAMEQYTANSNSSTEQIVVQAGQIQQQVREAVPGERTVPAPSSGAVCAPQCQNQPGVSRYCPLARLPDVGHLISAP